MNNGWSIARDIALIVVAFESIVIGALLILLVIQVQRLVRTLQKEIRPILDSTNQTVTTVRGTTAFVSEHLVSPIVRVNSVFAGVRRAAQVIRGSGKPLDPDEVDLS
jgi:hypothetical protein